MRILVVYTSYHRMSTEKVARAMALATGATLMRTEEVRPGDLDGYDLVGFGSGIYGGRHHKDLFALVERTPAVQGRRAFIFSTSGGAKAEEHHRPLREALAAKGCRVEGEFQCRGEFRMLGFIKTNRGHPDQKDLADARTFARGLTATP